MSAVIQPGFEVRARVAGECAVVSFEGEFDFDVKERVRAALEGVCEARVVVVDLRGLTFMDTSGIHVLLEARDRCRASGRMLLVVRGTARVQRGLAVLGLEDELEFVDAPA
jgi:anti-anti-sigma factor